MLVENSCFFFSHDSLCSVSDRCFSFLPYSAIYLLKNYNDVYTAWKRKVPKHEYHKKINKYMMKTGIKREKLLLKKSKEFSGTFKVYNRKRPVKEMYRSTDTICCHLELIYQFILSSRHSPGINLRWFPFNFSSIPSGSTFLKLSHGAVLTVCSHIFTLFWPRKTYAIVKKFQLSFCVFLSSLHFFRYITEM